MNHDHRRMASAPPLRKMSAEDIGLTASDGVGYEETYFVHGL
jgi:hypothetical protein